ncbi:uncharacterized protein LOC132783514 [Drosophila nasuta]|uniref:uncharacterized protein LOC132783514 n=1 Tax=Drosophila nasuta TaxID=42062 RepID=UPI00295EE6E6|nr:uncharacterized protein LOC132783514 [Drosophila nasuta]
MYRANINQINTGQVDISECFYQRRPVYRYHETDRYSRNVQMTECRNFLLQLGLRQYCVNQLTMELMQRPDIDLLQIRDNWNRVKQMMGPQRKSEADTIVLREIQQLLQERQNNTHKRDRSPSPPREIRTSTPTYANRGNFGCGDFDRPNMQNQSPRAQPPGNFCSPYIEPQYREEDAYNIHEDPRDLPHHQAIRYDDSDDNRIDDNCNRYPQQEQLGKNYNPLLQQEQFNYNCDPSYPQQEQLQRAMCNYREETPQPFPLRENNRNYDTNDNYDTHPREIPREQHLYRENNYDAYPRERLRDQQNHENEFHSRNYNNSFPRDHLRDQQSYREDSGNLTRQQINFYDDRGNKNHNHNYQPYSHEQRQQQFPRNDNYRYERSNQGKESQEPKRRRLEELPRQREFRISEFVMPYIKYRKDPLPQPERISYAIGFYQRRRTFPAGGMKETENQGNEPLEPYVAPFNPHRQTYKKIRRTIRAAWKDVYVTQEYSKWDLWWRGHKWCGDAIENELGRYADVNFNEMSFLVNKLYYGKRKDAVDKLFRMIHFAFSDSNDIHATLSTICELMNLQFLTNLKTSEMGQLQDLIRYVPNESWVYKMKAFVYLWARYSSIQCFVDPTLPTEDKEVLATKNQWNRPMFHWVAREAFAELKRISAIEWPEHKKTFREN